MPPRLRTDHPGRFGIFAYVPMPDIDGTLKEIEYALDVIKADGIIVSTSYGNKFLGDPDFKAVMDELQRRRAVVYVHPGRPECCDTLTPNVPGSFTEYPQDTNRTVMSLLFCRHLHPHARRTLDFLAWRCRRSAARRPRQFAGEDPAQEPGARPAKRHRFRAEAAPLRNR